MSKKVWVVPGYMERAVAKLFSDRGFEVYYHSGFPDDRLFGLSGPIEPDLIVLTGGADVNPRVYGEENKGSWGFDNARDAYELEIIRRYHGKVPFIGICRGAQLLNVMSGGRMIQDLPGHHSGFREIKINGDPVSYTAVTQECHHQGMIAASVGLVMAIDHMHKNHEVIWYPETKTFCFQAHPEYGVETAEVFFNMWSEVFDHATS